MGKDKTYKQIGDRQEPINDQTIHFQIQELKLEGRDLTWTMKLKIQQIIPKSFYELDILMFPNEEPFEDEIDDRKKAISKIDNENSLFEKDRKDRIKIEKDAMRDIEERRRQFLDDCDPIEFRARIQDLKYKSNSTVLTLWISDEVIIPLAKSRYQWLRMGVELRPREGQE